MLGDLLVIDSSFVPQEKDAPAKGRLENDAIKDGRTISNPVSFPVRRKGWPVVKLNVCVGVSGAGVAEQMLGEAKEFAWV